MKPWIRKTWIAQPQFDPTEVIRYTRTVLGFKIEIQAFWDSITLNVRRKNFKFFASDSIHPLINKVVEWKFRKLQQKYWEEVDKELESDPYPPLSYWE